MEFCYRYPFASLVERREGAAAVRLATCDARLKHPRFFDGLLHEPRAVCDLLLALTDVVRSDFRIPDPDLFDPVVTASEELLRFEAFSSCAGVYARIDLPADSFSARILGRGTTNVDFNDPMRAALTRVREDEPCRLAVGPDSVELDHGGEVHVEKKVKLPARWLSGFGEVQACQQRLRPHAEFAGFAARALLRSLPRTGTAKLPVLTTGTGPRFSRRDGAGRVRVEGVHRLRLLEPLLASARSLRVWADDAHGTSAWQLDVGCGCFFLLLSPGVYRGFSGEGGLLHDLAGAGGEPLVASVQGLLRWQARVDADALARSVGRGGHDVAAALAALGARGLVGYDVAAAAYFHRELPFDLDRVELLQPRLRNARRLLEQDRVSRLDESTEGQAVFGVGGTGVLHVVRLRDGQDRCTCPWFSKYRGQRGPCKHVLAARLFAESAEAPESPETP